MRKPKYEPAPDNTYKTTINLASLGFEIVYNPDTHFQKHYTLLKDGSPLLTDVNQGNVAEIIGKAYLGAPLNLTPSGLIDLGEDNIEIKGSEFSIGEDCKDTSKTDALEHYFAKTPATKHLLVVFNKEYTKAFVYMFLKSEFKVFCYQGNKNKGAVRYTDGKLRGRRQTERTLDEFVTWLIDYKAGLVKRERRK